MAEQPGYLTAIWKGGTSTAFTNEATTKVTANTVYQITDSTKRVLDPTVTVTVEVDADGAGGGGYVAGTGYTIDYYTGTVTFAADQGSSALVRVSGSYIPILSVASAKASNLKIGRTILDCTKFSATPWRTYLYGLLEISGDLDLVEDGLTDHDPGAGTQKFVNDLVAATLVLLAIQPGGTGSVLRTWATLTAVDGAAAVDGLVTTKVAFTAAGRSAAVAASWAA